MGLSFSDENIKNITKQQLELPLQIDNPEQGTGYVQQKETLLEQKDILYANDQDQKIFSDFWIETANLYHTELSYLADVQRSSYANSYIVLGAQSKEPHFPTDPIWVNLTPKVIPQNTGDPTSSSPHALDLEPDIMVDLNESINLLKNGFSEGTFNDSVDSVNGTSFEVDDLTGIGDLAVNQRIIITGSGLACYGQITSITAGQAPTPPDTEFGPSTVEYTVLAGETGAIGSASCANSHPGFTNAQRSRATPVSGGDAVILDIFESFVTGEMLRWQTNLVGQETSLINNGDLLPRRTANEIALTNVQTALSIIASWIITPIADPNGRFTDTILGIVQAHVTVRTSQITARMSLITGTQLGTLTQATDGSVTGSGVYFDMFLTVNLRSAKGTGTLSAYYQIDMGVTLFDKKIDDANALLTQYNNVFATTTIISDTDIGDTVIEVDNASEFSTGIEVMSMDNETIIYRRNIISISGNTITLDNGIPVELTLNNLARMAFER